MPTPTNGGYAPDPPRGPSLTAALARGGLWVGHGFLPSGHVTPPHRHVHPTVGLVLGGAFRARVGREELDAPEGTFFVRPAGVSMSSRIGRQDTRLLIVSVEDPGRLAGVPRLTKLLGTGQCRPAGRLSWIGQRLQQEIAAGDSASALSIEGLALELLAEGSRLEDAPASGAAPWLRRVSDRLDGEFRDRLTLSELAREAGVHPVHLARAFRLHYGETVGERTRRLRLEWCRRQLADTERSVTAIALAAGFADHAHLSRQFRRAFGCSPSQHRRDARR